MTPNAQFKYRTAQALDVAFWPRALGFFPQFIYRLQKTLRWKEEGSKSISFYLSQKNPQKPQALEPNTDSTAVAAGICSNNTYLETIRLHPPQFCPTCQLTTKTGLSFLNVAIRYK